MRYTWDSVIIDPTSDKAKNAIGKEVYYDDNPRACLESANDNNCFCGVLQSMEPTKRLPFVVNGKHYECIIVKTTSVYEQYQAKWIADNGVKEGDCVKVLRKAGEDEEDWGDAWIPDMDNYVGSFYEITEICPDGIELDSEYLFPYFVLEKVADRYEPFASTEEFLVGYSSQFKEDPDMLTSAIWLKSVAEVYSLVTEIWSDGVVMGNDADVTSWEDLLEHWMFLNGTPCGKSKDAQ